MQHLRRFIPTYLRPHLSWYAGGTVALLVTNWLSVAIPVEVARGVDALAAGDRAAVWPHAWMVMGMGVGVIAIRTLSRVMYFTPGRRVEAQIKRDLFESILRHQPGTLRPYATGDLFSRLNSDVTMVRVFAGFGTLTVVNVAISVVLAGGQMLRLSPLLAAWLLVPVILSFFVVQLLIRKLFTLIRKMQMEIADISEHVLGTLKGMATVQGHHAEAAFTERFDKYNLTYEHSSVERSQIRALLAPALTLASSLNLFLLLLIGGPLAARGEISVGTLVAFAALVNFINGPLRQSSFLVSVLQQAEASLERIDALVRTPPDRSDVPNPEPAPTAAPAIHVRGLTVQLGEDGPPALDAVDLDIPAGQTVGLFGPTGAGKTTLLRVLARLQPPTAGTVLVNDTPLSRIDLDAWRRTVTFVTQRAFLFSEALADNLLLSPPEGDDDPRLHRALTLGALTPDVERLPEGTATLVGESGVRLSGGQRQRVALARGLLRDTPVLLLDDVLSAVDHHTEAELVARLEDARARGATAVLVAHRVSALLHCDHVVVLDRGRVVDAGTPADLLARPGLLAETWAAQQNTQAGAA